MSKKFKMTVTMNVTEHQALALQAMFESWNNNSLWENDKVIGFYINGSGDFYPECKCEFERELTPLSDEELKAIRMQGQSTNHHFDYTMLE